MIARIGGDEFVIAMPETDIFTANRKLERFKQSIATMQIPLAKTGATATVTISGGLAVFPKDGNNEQELFAVADRRLFQAKAEGRNRIVG